MTGGGWMRATLLGWRLSLEQQFRFDPNHALDRRDVIAIEQEMNQMRADAIRLLTGGPHTLQGSLNTWYAKVTAIE
jgi:DNA-binding helix-hairpin-helix protein with protein kinase domain